MKYRTQMGNLSPSEMTDNHLNNRIEFEIQKLKTAKTIINEDETEQTPFQLLLEEQANRMTTDKAVNVIQTSADVLAPLVFEKLLRGQDAQKQINSLVDLYERKTLILNKVNSLFLDL